MFHIVAFRKSHTEGLTRKDGSEGEREREERKEGRDRARVENEETWRGFMTLFRWSRYSL